MSFDDRVFDLNIYTLAEVIRFDVPPTQDFSSHERTIVMIKMSDVCILLAVMVAFAISGFLWFSGQKEEGLFTAIWVPSILCFGIYFKVLGLKGRTHD